MKWTKYAVTTVGILALLSALLGYSEVPASAATETSAWQTRSVRTMAPASHVQTQDFTAEQALAQVNQKSKVKRASAKKLQIAPPIQAMVDGVSFPAIRVGGDQTYIKWSALIQLHTPYAYEGNGIFDITGGTITGVIYHGATYLPWNQLAPKVKATRLSDEKINFTSIPVTHDYHIVLNATLSGPTMDAVSGIGSPSVLTVALLDGQNVVPNQRVDIHLSGTSFFSSYQNKSDIQVHSSPAGYDIYGINDYNQQPTEATVSWTDPLGEVLTSTENITFHKLSEPTEPSTPAADTVVTTAPVTIFQDMVLFNVTTLGYRQQYTEMFQLDTGAQIPLINGQMASELHLPNLGNSSVQGVTGQSMAYVSKISFILGGQSFTDVPCMVDPSYTGTSLLGYNFFYQNGYDILLSAWANQNSLIVLSPSTSPVSTTSAGGDTSQSSGSSTPQPTGTSVQADVPSTNLTVTLASGAKSSPAYGPESPLQASRATSEESVPAPAPVSFGTPQPLWNGYEGDVGSNAVIAGNAVVAADADSNGAVYAYDLKTGAKLWEYDQENYYKGVLAGSPTTVLMTIGNGVLALSATTGQQMWSPNIAGFVLDMQIVDAKAIIATPYHVYVLDATTGQTIYTVSTPWRIAKISGNTNGLAIGTIDGKLIQISWSGQVSQQAQLTDNAITGIATDANNGWIVTQATSVADIEGDGTERWISYYHSNIEGGNVSVDGQYAALATANGNLYLLNTQDGSIYASASLPLGASIYTPTASGGIIYEVNRVNTLSIFDEATLHQQQVVSSYGPTDPLNAVMSPLVSGGTVIVQSHFSGSSGDATLLTFN